MLAVRVFPYLVAWLELCACLVYLYHREWRMSVLWGGYAVAAFALAAVR